MRDKIQRLNFLAYEPDWEELEVSTENCPRCKSLMYVEPGYLPVYRCRNCRFEGAKEPLSLLVGKLREVWRATR